MVESGMYAMRPEIEISGFSSSHQTEEEQLDFLEINLPNYDPGLPVCPFCSLPVFPSTLAELNDFKEEIPAIFLKYELPPRNSSETDEEWSFLDFLEKIPPAKVTWEFDNMNKVLHFGQYFRKIFMGIADILYSYHKSNLFSGDVIGRMRIHNDLRITHPYTPANTSHNDYLDGRSRKMKKDLDGRKVDIIHFRWLVAKVVRKFCGEDYESHLSKYFKLCFSELFLHSDGLERYYMFQYYHPVFYNDGDKYKLVHVLADLRKRDVRYFTQYFGLHDPEYGYHCWWSSLAKENHESMLGGVYLYKDNKIAAYDNNSNSLPIFLRNCHEHFTEGTETKNKKNVKLNRQIEEENKKVRKKMSYCGQQRKLELELELTTPKQNILPDQLPFHCELEPKITERFPGIYACMIDSCIRGFNDNGERRFGCTLAQLLFDKSPFGCQQQQVGYIGAATSQTEIAP
ncbi:uncharacterized protein LOC115969154 isoform X2 [Quercus lobata]|uniref:uncharacterized protein LOC115969154 isoform X2 n=1 Tax=Quercus lobata TaxID=97700 RepID=UPI001245F8AF|nr:uncharacterized protein LOC115969154 isoform X2 [Quercus lobata]